MSYESEALHVQILHHSERRIRDANLPWTPKRRDIDGKLCGVRPCSAREEAILAAIDAHIVRIGAEREARALEQQIAQFDADEQKSL